MTEGESCKIEKMRIERLIWPQDRIDHIARHAVTPEEVVDIDNGKTDEKNKAAKNGFHTEAGRILGSP